jgi:hypothetical protein
MRGPIRKVVAVMTRKATKLSQRPACPVGGRARSVGDIEDVIGGIVSSDEPPVVLSSLARACNPSFSDACAVELSEGVDRLFQVSFPMPDDAAPTCAAQASAKTVTTAFHAASGFGYPAFAGVLVHSWIGRDPIADDAIIARLLVDRALAIVQHERLAQSAARADDRAAKLAIDLITSRLEGEAIGILMARHQASEEEAVGLLRQLSWTSQRQVREAAADVVHTADLQRGSESYASSPGRREQLHVVALRDKSLPDSSKAFIHVGFMQQSSGSRVNH